jgi:hypothetical protein
VRGALTVSDPTLLLTEGLSMLLDLAIVANFKRDCKDILSLLIDLQVVSSIAS